MIKWYQKRFRKFGTGGKWSGKSVGRLGKTCEKYSISTKSTFFSKINWYAETQSYQGFAALCTFFLLLFAIVAKESCTQLYKTIEK